MAVVGRHGGKARSGKGNTARRHPGHHRQEPFQDGIDPDNRCHTGARSRHFIELSEEEATFDDGNTETVSRPAQIPEDKLDETFTSLTPSDLEFGEDEPEEETPDAPRASGSSFDEIDDAVRTAKNPEATTTERERAAKVFTDMEGTELYEKLMTGSSEMSIRIKGLIEIRLKKPKKDFVVPDNIEDFDIRNYV